MTGRSRVINLLKFNSSRYRIERYMRRYAIDIEPGSLVLDAGAGSAPYARLFEHVRYETADFNQVDKPYGNQTYVCDLKKIPVENERFDYIIFNQVLEHLPDPASVLAELHRVLKNGGKILYTGPLYYEEHEQPYDFYRYTQYGVKHLFNKAGFTLEKLEWLEGYFGTLAYQFRLIFKYLPVHPRNFNYELKVCLLIPFLLILKTISLPISLMLHWAETKFKYTASGHPKNYLAIARK